MKFNRIFTKEIKCRLWSVVYPEERSKRDIFSIVFNNWNNPEYLYDFFEEHQKKLSHPYFEGMEVEDAIDKIYDEVNDFEKHILKIQKKIPGYEHLTLDDLFTSLHSPEYTLAFDKENQKKAKPYFTKPLLRLYAIKLDNAFIVTGGAIKLVKEMRGSYLQVELDNLIRVQKFIKDIGILDVEEFDDL